MDSRPERTPDEEEITSPSAATRRSYWPAAVFLSLALFTLLFITFGIIATLRQKNYLASDHYFVEGQDYQQIIDARQRTAALDPPLQVLYHDSPAILEVVLPEAHSGKKVRGRIEFYRPSGADLDRQFPLVPDASGRQVLPLGSLPQGAWKTRVRWVVDQELYLVDGNLFLEVGHDSED